MLEGPAEAAEGSERAAQPEGVVVQPEKDEPTPKKGPRALHELSESERHDLCREFWDQHCGGILLYDLVGWGPDRIARFIGTTEERVDAVLHPRPVPRFDSEANGLKILDGSEMDAEAVSGDYEAMVWVQILNRLMAGWRIADWRADFEGFPEVVAEAQGRYAHYCESVGSLRSLPWPVFGDLSHDVALWLCAWEDADQALAVLPPSDLWHPTLFLGKFHEHLEMARTVVRFRDSKGGTFDEYKGKYIDDIMSDYRHFEQAGGGR
jgi:hypothetical protein